MRHIFTNQCWRNWNFCRYAKMATGSAATSVMYFTKVLRGDQSIKFGHSNLIYMPVMPWHICRLWLRKPNATDLTCPNSQTAGFVRTLCCRWARAPSSSRHPPKSGYTADWLLCVFFLRGNAPPSSFLVWVISPFLGFVLGADASLEEQIWL